MTSPPSARATRAARPSSPKGFRLAATGFSFTAVMKRAAAADGGVLLLQELGEVAFAAGGKAREDSVSSKPKWRSISPASAAAAAHQDGVALSGGERRLQPRAQGERCHVLLVQAPGDLANRGLHG